MERIGLEPGSEVGGYTVVAPLGSGGMGTVYRAVDGGGAAVALKLLHPQAGADAESRARLLREVAALQRLRHPAVAAVLDAEADSSEAFLVTELVDGLDLEETVRRDGPLAPDDLVGLASGLRDALVAVHGAGVLHRDLKPSNVLLTQHGPVLIDFGLAQGEHDERVTSTGLVAGTPGYLAPEQLDGADPDEAGDWWGWAALLAFAATGRPPFGKGRVTTVLARTRAGKADLVGLAPAVRAALRGALAADPALRTGHDDVVASLGAAARPATAVLPRQATGRAGRSASGAADEPADDECGAGEDDDEGATAVLTGADAAGTVLLTGADAAGTAVLSGADAAGATAVLAGADVAATTALAAGAASRVVAPSARDGHTVAVAVPVPPAGPPTVTLPDDNTLADAYDDDYDENGDEPGPDDPQYAAVEMIEDDLDASAGDDLEGSGFHRPQAPRRWATQAAGALVVLAAGALWPGWTLVVVVGLLLLARAFGLTVEGMYDREERRGLRRTDGLVAVVSTPWYALRAVLGLVPALLVAASVLVIGVGVAWWFVGDGRWTIGDNAPGQELAGTTAALLVGVVTLVGALLVWFGPASRMTRLGTRRLLELVSPGRLGALVLVVLLLVGAGILGSRALHGAPIVWDPLPTPVVPMPQPEEPATVEPATTP